MPRRPKVHASTVAYGMALLAIVTGSVLLASFIAAELLLGVQGERSVRTFEIQARRLTNDSADTSNAEASVPAGGSLRSDAILKPLNRTHALQTHRTVGLPELPEGVEGLLRIPALGIRVPVYSGTDEFALSRGAGRVEWTPPLGSSGNVGVAAHRDRAFRALKDIAKGDAILVDLLEGTLHYEVVGIRIVDPEDVHVLAHTETPHLTLVTCYPFNFIGSAPHRFIVHARLASGADSVLSAETSAAADATQRVAY